MILSYFFPSVSFFFSLCLESESFRNQKWNIFMISHPLKFKRKCQSLISTFSKKKKSHFAFYFVCLSKIHHTMHDEVMNNDCNYESFFFSHANRLQMNKRTKRKKPNKIISLCEMITNFRLISFCTEKNRFFNFQSKPQKKNSLHKFMNI